MPAKSTTAHAATAVLILSAALSYGLITSAPELAESNSVEDESHERYGMAPEAMEELYATYVDPATGRIPPGVRGAELELVNRLPKREERLSKSGEPVYAWAEAGPTNSSGRVRALAVDVTDPNIVIVGAASGGIWKTTDEGTTWALKSTPGQHLSVTSIVQDPRPGFTQTWYSGGGEYRGGTTASDRGFRAPYGGVGIQKSTDNGETWSLLDATIVTVPSSSNQFFTDPKTFEYVSRLEVSPTTGALLVANNGDGIYRSDDGGESFQLVLGQPRGHRWSDVAIGTDGKLVAVLSDLSMSGSPGAAGAGIYTSSDDGVSWNLLITQPLGVSRSLIRIAPSDPTRAYLLTVTGQTRTDGHEDNRFYAIDLAAGTAEERTENLPFFPGTPSNGASVHTFNTFCMVLAVKPDDANFVIVGGSSLFKSPTGFTTKIPISGIIGGYNSPTQGTLTPNHYVDQHAAVFSPHDPDALWSTNDGGAFVNRDVSAFSPLWESKREGLNVTQLYSVAIPDAAGDPRIVGSSQDNGTRLIVDERANDGGFSASFSIAIGDGTDAYIGREFVYSDSQFGFIRRHRYLNGDSLQIDPNRQLQSIAPPNATGQGFAHRFAVDPNDESTLFYPAGTVVWRLSGSIWSPVNTLVAPAGYSIFPIALSRVPAHVLYFGANSSAGRPVLMRLENANSATSGAVNVSIPSAPAGAFVHDVAINHLDANEIMVVLSNYNVTGIYRSTDGGETYQAVEGNLTGTPQLPGPSIRSAAIVPFPGIQTTAYFVGTSAGLFMTTELNGDNTEWVREAHDLLGNVPIGRIAARASDGRVAVATLGRGIFVGDVDPESVVATEDSPDIARGFAIGPTYPNPFVDRVTVPVELESPASVDVRVIDVAGRVVARPLVGARLAVGRRAVQIDLGHLSAGLYFVRLVAETSQGPVIRSRAVTKR